MYELFKFIHIVGAFGFVLAHGVSAAMALRLRHERNPDRIRVMLQVSSSSLGIFYVSILLLLVGGIVMGFQRDWWSAGGWIWVALGTFVLTMLAMYAVATPYYRKVRAVMKIQDSGSSAVGEAEIEQVLRSNRPMAIVWVGVVSLGFILYLMVFKPF